MGMGEVLLGFRLYLESGSLGLILQFIQEFGLKAVG